MVCSIYSWWILCFWLLLYKYVLHFNRYFSRFKTSYCVFLRPYTACSILHSFTAFNSGKYHVCILLVYSVSQTPLPAIFWQFLPNGREFLINFLHTYYTFLSTRWQIFIQLSPTLTKLCHTTLDHPANFYISLEHQLLRMLTEHMTSLLTSCHIQHVCFHYKSVLKCYRQRSTKLSTTYANVWTHAFRPMVDILSVLRELGSHA